MKLHTTKEWFRSRAHLEEGHSIEVRPAKETPSSGSERRLLVDSVDCEGCWTWGIPESEIVTDEECQDCCPLCDQPYLVTHTGQPSPKWGGDGGKQFIHNVSGEAR